MQHQWFDRQKQRANIVDKTAKAAKAEVQKKLFFNEVPNIPLMLGMGLIAKGARERTNQLESKTIWRDEGLVPTDIKETLEKSYFRTLRRVSSRRAFIEGKMWWMWIPNPVKHGKFIVDVWSIYDLTKIGNNYYKVKCFTSQTVIISNITYPIVAEIIYNGRNTILNYNLPVVNSKGEMKPVNTKTITYMPTKTMVGGPFFANEEGIPELMMLNIPSLTKFLDYLSTEFIHSTFRGRDWWTLNTNFVDLEDDDFERNLRSGHSSVPENSPNQKVASGQTPILSGSAQQTFSQVNYNFLEDKIKEYLGLQRDLAPGTGAQKESLQITLFNAFASETLQSIKDVREDDYKVIIASLCELLKFDDKKTKETINNIELRLSDIEQAKIDLLKAKVEEARNKSLKLKADVTAISQRNQGTRNG